MYHKIKNPETGRTVSIYGKTGQHILRTYLNILQQNGGFIRGGVRLPSDNYLDTTTSCNSQVGGGLFDEIKDKIGPKKNTKKMRLKQAVPYRKMIEQYVKKHGGFTGSDEEGMTKLGYTVDSIVSEWVECSKGDDPRQADFCNTGKINIEELNHNLENLLGKVEKADDKDKQDALNQVLLTIMAGGYTKLTGTNDQYEYDLKCISGLVRCNKEEKKKLEEEHTNWVKYYPYRAREYFYKQYDGTWAKVAIGAIRHTAKGVGRVHA